MAMRAPARAKWLAPSWLAEVLEGLAYTSLYDPFCGTGALAIAFKRRGKRVVASDLLEGHYCFARALVENQTTTVSAEQARDWLSVIKDPAVATRFSPWATAGHFTPEEAIWLGIWNAHLGARGLDPVVKALGVVAVGLTMRYWLGFNRRGQGLKPMSPPVAFQHYLQTVNTWVCNSGLGHQALWGDAQQLAPRVEADLLVCYPPTDMGFLDASDELQLLEGWVKGDPDRALPGTLAAASGAPSLGLPLGDPGAYTEALRRFLAASEHFPLWAIALNDRYPLDEAALVALIQEFRPVVRRARLDVARGEPGSPPRETLVIAQARSQ